MPAENDCTERYLCCMARCYMTHTQPWISEHLCHCCQQDPETQRQDKMQQPRLHSGLTAASQAPLQLLELALQFLIYTESANLRHTPHLLFLIYYIMRGSQAFQQVGVPLTVFATWCKCEMDCSALLFSQW